MIEGRAEDQKQRIAELVTKAMIEGAGVKSDDTWIVLEDVSRRTGLLGVHFCPDGNGNDSRGLCLKGVARHVLRGGGGVS